MLSWVSRPGGCLPLLLEAGDVFLGRDEDHGRALLLKSLTICPGISDLNADTPDGQEM